MDKLVANEKINELINKAACAFGKCRGFGRDSLGRYDPIDVEVKFPRNGTGDTIVLESRGESPTILIIERALQRADVKICSKKEKGEKRIDGRTFGITKTTLSLNSAWSETLPKLDIAISKIPAAAVDYVSGRIKMYHPGSLQNVPPWAGMVLSV